MTLKVHSLTVWGILLLLAVLQAGSQRESCCYGRGRAAHGETVLNIPSCCVSFVCSNGDIRPTHFGGPGATGCNHGCPFDGLLYPNGTQLTAHCAPLICVAGKWQRTGRIESCCEHCYLFNVGHIVTFDNNYYNWAGACNYSVVQTGQTHYPEAAVFTSFKTCFNTTCLHQTTFRNDPHTLISLSHVPGNAIFEILVNGQLYNVPRLGVQEIRIGLSTHPVLAWRDRRCLFLLGSSQLMVQHCYHRLDVWAYPSHISNIHGLCGQFNFNPTDDMTARDGTVYLPHLYPLAFPESWRTSEQSSGMCSQPCEHCNKPTKSDVCKASPEDGKKYTIRCQQRLHPVLGVDTQLRLHIDACEVDLCYLARAGVAMEHQQEWLVTVVQLAQNSKIILAMTLGSFVPDPLFASLDGLCVSGSSWQQECNRCSCTEGQAVPVCTRRGCLEDFVPDLGAEYCNNGSRWRRDECNVCECIRSGILCSFENCSTSPTIASTRVTTARTFPPFFVCALPKSPGSCSGHTLRWYYDSRAVRCSQFYYTGCGGNVNNFMTEGECLSMCGNFVTPTTDTSRCHLSWDAGTCGETQLKYYYVPEATQCFPAFYSGCGGNNNRFDSPSECLLFCGGSVTAPTGSISAKTISPTQSVTMRATFRPFSVCILPRRPGFCKGYILRWYYDPQAGRCFQFSYTGCGGNMNNFVTEEECLVTCRLVTATIVPTTSVKPSGCNLRPEVGPCLARLPRYYYNPAEDRCQLFFYGGCRGNFNNFLTAEFCLATCGGFNPEVTAPTVHPSVCHLRWDAGTCQGFQVKYYYDSETERCFPAYYTGCGGNGNRFDTLEQCVLACGGTAITTGSTAHSTCPPSFPVCPQDCFMSIDPSTNCMECVCDTGGTTTTTTTPAVYLTLPTASSTCPSDLLTCPLYCSTVTLTTDPATGCSVCVCNFSSVPLPDVY